MKKFAFLLVLALGAGCDSDDDSTFLPDPGDEVPAPGELPTQVTVLQYNLQDEVCPDASPLDRKGILSHTWTAITAFEADDDEVMVAGDLLSAWQNECYSETPFPGTTETYEMSITSDMIITTTPEYFQP